MKLNNFSLVVTFLIALVAVGCGKKNDSQDNASSPIVNSSGITQQAYGIPTGCYATGVNTTNCTNGCPVGTVMQNNQCVPLTQGMPNYTSNPCYAYPGTFYNAYFNTCMPAYTTCQWGQWSAMYGGGCLIPQHMVQYVPTTRCTVKSVLGGFGYVYTCRPN